VQITNGAFRQLEAIFVANDGDERVVLLLNILQRNQKLVFPIESVRKLC
jgi:transcriptional antiterminator RfaH